MSLADLMKPYLDEMVKEVTAVLEKETDLDVLRNALVTLQPFIVEGIVQPL
jgi:hypothetical protein